MKALSVIGLLLAAAIIATVPISPQVTPQGLELRIDQAQAQLTYGRARRVARRVVYGGAYYRYDPSYGYDGYVVPNYGRGYPVDGYGYGYPAYSYGSYPSYRSGYSYPSSYGYGYAPYEAYTYGGYGPRIRIGWGRRGWW
jgi:hypothetical protein